MAASYKFIIRGKNSKNQAVIYLRYTAEDGTKQKNYSYKLFSTGQKIDDPDKNWNDKEGKPKSNYTDKELKDSLDQFKAKIRAIERDLEREGKTPTPEVVQAIHKQREEEDRPETILSQSLVKHWRDFLDSKPPKKGNTGITEGTRRTIRNVIDCFERYLASVNKTALSPDKLTLKDVKGFETFMERKEEYTANTQARFLKKLKEFLKDYKSDGGELNINLEKIKYSETAGIKLYLTKEELTALENLELEGRQVHIRDLFLLQCMTGLRISDLKRIDQNIAGDRIELVTQKTGARIIIPIVPMIRAILEKYNYSLPQYWDVEVNRQIKKIFKKACPLSAVPQVKDENGNFQTVYKWEKLSSHDAIRTFCKVYGRNLPVTTLAKVTGKSLDVLTKHYLPDADDEEVTAGYMLALGEETTLKIAK